MRIIKMGQNKKNKKRVNVSGYWEDEKNRSAQENKAFKRKKRRFFEDEDEEEDIVNWKIRDEHGKK